MSNHADPSDVTLILQAWSAGDASAAERLMPLVYEELRRLAAQYLRRERPDHTLQATALVHETYLRLVDQNRVSTKDRAHFRSLAARLMRRILVEHARRHNAEKRGGKLGKISLEETRELSTERPPNLVDLDDALTRFSAAHPREGEVVEMKFFGGLQVNEIAVVLKVSAKTVMRDWNFAKLWLCRDLSEPA